MFTFSSDELNCSVEFDFDADACYISLTDNGSVDSTVEKNTYIADFNKFGEVVGVEVFMNRSASAVEMALDELDVDELVQKFVAMMYEVATTKVKKFYTTHNLVES